MRNMTLHTVALALFVAACDDGASDLRPDMNDNPADPSDPADNEPNPNQQARMIFGSLGDGTSLSGNAAASSATDVEVVTIDEDGTEHVNGSGEVAADGSFNIEVSDVGRHAFVRATDVSGNLLASVALHAEGEEDADAGELSLDTTVVAEVWASIVSDHDSRGTLFGEVESRIDAETTAALDAWYDGNGDSHAMFDLFADAIVAGSATRREQAESAGVRWTTGLNAAIESAHDGTADSFAAAIDAALAVQGMTGESRSRAASEVEATIRAVLDASAESGDNDAIDGFSSLSADIESSLHLLAWSEIADGEGEGSLAAELAAALSLGISGDGDDGDLDTELDLALTAWLGGIFDDGDGGGSAGLLVNLGIFLGLDVEEDDAGDAEEAWQDRIDRLRADLRLRIDAALEASAQSGEDVSDDIADAYAAFDAEIAVMLEGVADEGDRASLTAALQLRAGALVNAD